MLIKKCKPPQCKSLNQTKWNCHTILVAQWKSSSGSLTTHSHNSSPLTDVRKCTFLFCAYLCPLSGRHLWNTLGISFFPPPQSLVLPYWEYLQFSWNWQITWTLFSPTARMVKAAYHIPSCLSSPLLNALKIRGILWALGCTFCSLHNIFQNGSFKCVQVMQLFMS